MIVFLSNFLNHHQYPVARELFKLTEGEYRFIELEPMPESFRQGGYPTFESEPFLIQAWRSKEIMAEAKRLIEEADTLVYGYIPNYKLLRNRLNNKKLTFECSERWFKRGWINILSPRLLRSQFYYHVYFYNKPLYRLNASAYAANDLSALYSFKNKMFKWGYFTEVPEVLKNDSQNHSNNKKLKILFVARFLILKHPEIPVYMAKRLKDKGYKFELNMYGTGPRLANIQSLINELGVDDIVKLCGNKPNKDILKEMANHDVFLFTSDRHEGWGAVLNEAMACGCAVVASDAIGSVPFLIKNGINGLVFKSGSIDSITQNVEILLQNRELCHSIGLEAAKTLRNIWSPKNAAKQLLQLIGALTDNSGNIPVDGPCSKAFPISKT